MLVLSRKINERVFVGGNNELVVTVLEIKGSTVRLGFEAPADLPIRRAELVGKLIGAAPKPEAL